ncbi:MAG TPA: hypothetical protein VF282_00270 [Bacillota bacterium]
MKFRPEVAAAYAPAQAATATDAAGRPVVLLFVPQWGEVVRAVAGTCDAANTAPAETQWAFSREIGLLILFVRFAGGWELAVTFAPGSARELLSWWEGRQPVDLVLSAGPLQDVEHAALGFPRPDRDAAGDPGGAAASAGAAGPAYVRVPAVPFITG